MKFEFNKDASRILDYLIFPRLFYFIDDEEHEEDGLKSLIKEEFLNYVEELIKNFKPYQALIEKFYQKDIYSNIDFIHIVMKAYSPYTYDDEHKYLTDLANIDDYSFRTEFMKSLITMDDDVSLEDMDHFLVDESQAIKYINNLKIESSSKWNMLLMIQDPKKNLLEFIELMTKLEPYFYSYYQKHEHEVAIVGEALAKKLSISTNETLKALSYHAVNYDFGDSDSCHLYISATFPYIVRFSDQVPCRIVWGLEMEESFKKLHELNEDKMVQRVKVFKALGDKTRYDTIRLIASGISSIKEIATQLDVSSATISYHINEFLTSGIISLNKSKDKKSQYVVDYEKLEYVLDELRVDLNFPK